MHTRDISKQPDSLILEENEEIRRIMKAVPMQNLNIREWIKMKNIFANKKDFLLLNLGLLIVALGVHFFKAPNNFATGGTTGVSIILSTLIPGLNVGHVMLIINVLLVIIGFIFLGKKFAAGTIYSSLALPFFIWLLEAIWPLAKPLTDDKFLELCFAVILPAAGSGIVFNIGASTGGTDIVAMILSKHTDLEIGKALLVSDFVITVIAGSIYGIKTGLYCVLGLLVKAFLLDVVIESINVRKHVTIISKESKAIEEYIINVLNRGATISKACGAYTGEEKEIITTVLGRRQTVMLRDYIRSIDKDAFITIVNSSETIGKGFRTI
jgi:uncharacterized membrane-anchored protein YitT (DUF2179 family)